MTEDEYPGFEGMKNQYFGDINDYRKYGLLRCFVGAGFRLGVCWMLTEADGSADGGKIPYLNERERWRDCDPDLFDFLDQRLRERKRDVSELERSRLLADARFFADLLSDKAEERKAYWAKAERWLSGLDLLFFDPDNGLEADSVERGDRNSSKYLYWDEVKAVASTGVSLVLFQHWRREKRRKHTAELSAILSRLMPPGTLILPIRTSNVLFLTAWQPAHQARLPRFLQLISERWGLDMSDPPKPRDRTNQGDSADAADESNTQGTHV